MNEFTMKGSEKQIAWANELRLHMIRFHTECNESDEKLREMDPNFFSEGEEKARKIGMEFYNKIIDIDDAKFWITCKAGCPDNPEWMYNHGIRKGVIK